MRQAGAGGRLKIRWKNFETFTRQKAFPRPTRMEADLQAMAQHLFKKITLTQPVRLIGFGVTGLVADFIGEMEKITNSD